MRKKGSLIFLKLGTLKFKNKKMCPIFEFSDFAQKMWKKIRFKFEKSEKIYRRSSERSGYVDSCKVNDERPPYRSKKVL